MAAGNRMVHAWRPALALVLTALLSAAGCGAERSGSDELTAGTTATIATTATTTPPVSTSGQAIATAPTTAPDASSTGDEWDVIVTASVVNGMIDRVEVTQLEVLGGSGAEAPWLRFGLALHHCCGEPNSVVFPADQWSVTTEAGRLRVVGPACDDVVACDDDERRVTFRGDTPVAVFEAFRDVAGAAPSAAGTSTATIGAVFHWDGDVIEPEPAPITIRIDVSPPAPPPAGDTTPVATPLGAVEVVAGGLNLGTTPVVGVADTGAQLAALLAETTEPIDVAALGIDWASQAAIVLTLGSDLCPPVLAGLTVDAGVATPVFANPGYRECEQPYVPYAVVAAVDRNLLAGATELVLGPDLAYDGTGTSDGSPSVAAVSIAPPSAERSAVPTVIAFGDVTGTAPLPRRGEVVTAALDDGTPVYVVHHHDGTVSALDARGETGPTGEGGQAGGTMAIVRWTAAARTFLGRGAWDEYGRRLDGFRAADLTGYATRVAGEQVEIGAAVPPPAGTPIAVTAVPPSAADVAITPTEPIALSDAIALPPGRTAWITAVVVTDPTGAAVCERGEQRPGDAGCADAIGVAATPGFAGAFFGPLLATRAGDGFERIASTGGYGGSSL